MELSPANMAIWNRNGLVAVNGVVTVSVHILARLLDGARDQGRGGQVPRHAAYPDSFVAPNGETVSLTIHQPDTDPCAEVRDSETGDLIFSAVKGPLEVIEGGKQ